MKLLVTNRCTVPAPIAGDDFDFLPYDEPSGSD
jgi:hypothetical protein